MSIVQSLCRNSKLQFGNKTFFTLLSGWGAVCGRCKDIVDILISCRQKVKVSRVSILVEEK